jgi:hypothetical protein
VSVEEAEVVAAAPDETAGPVCVAVRLRVTATVPAFAGAVPDRVEPETASPVTSAGAAVADHVPAAAIVSVRAAVNGAPARAVAPARVEDAGVTVTGTLLEALSPPWVAVMTTV